MVISINGKRHEIPSCFEELTTKQWELLVPEFAKDVDARDHFKMFQILSGTEFNDFHATAENEVTIWNCIRWLYEQEFKFSEVPKVLQVNSRLITIPKKMDALSIGQNIHLRQLLNGANYQDEKISDAVAIYLQPLYYGKKFNYERAMEFKADIEKMPAYLIRPIGFFLFKSVSGSGRKRTSLWQKTLSSLSQICARMWPHSLKLTGSYHLRT